MNKVLVIALMIGALTATNSPKQQDAIKLMQMQTVQHVSIER